MAKILKGNPPMNSSAVMVLPPKGMVVGGVAYGNQTNISENGGNMSNNGVVSQQLKPHEPNQQPPILLHNGSNTVLAAGVTSPEPYQLNSSQLANTKEKTPMCLINELARHNKILHQYTLVDETGPAHKKTFYVKLKLGDEEYNASGASIKKGQHSAAMIALEKTAYKHPPPKPPRTFNQNLYVSANNMTPTVELNALAMKRGEHAAYHQMEPHRPHYYQAPNYDYRGMYNQRYHYPRMPRIFYVLLKVGQRDFIGDGATRQAARHSAADKALKVLRNLPMPDAGDKKPDDASANELEPASSPEIDECTNDELKSEISLVHELALKRKLSVNFEVKSETGPPHMKTFVTQCIVGDMETEGEGNGKKISKKRAAEKMLEKLRKLPPLPPTLIARPRQKLPLPGNKKKNRNLIKMQKADPGYGVGINPISRLIQIQQAIKEREPIYTMVEERGLPRRREFVMQVKVGQHECNGIGPNKKLAKRNAAEAMLQMLGYSRPSPQPTKPAIKMNSGHDMAGDKKVTFVENDLAMGRQLVPGVLLMPEAIRHGIGIIKPGTFQVGDIIVNNQTMSIMAKELIELEMSPTAESLRKVEGKQPLPPNSLVRPKQKLHYLADILGFQVQFTDFPKGNNKNEFLSLVSLATNPPQVSHGAGPTTEASHDAAALTALKSLVEMAVAMEKKGAGDGPSSMKIHTDK